MSPRLGLEIIFWATVYKQVVPTELQVRGPNLGMGRTAKGDVAQHGIKKACRQDAGGPRVAGRFSRSEMGAGGRSVLGSGKGAYVAPDGAGFLLSRNSINSSLPWSYRCGEFEK
jgi:hypothetical protein